MRSSHFLLLARCFVEPSSVWCAGNTIWNFLLTCWLKSKCSFTLEPAVRSCTLAETRVSSHWFSAREMVEGKANSPPKYKLSIGLVRSKYVRAVLEKNVELVWVHSNAWSQGFTGSCFATTTLLLCTRSNILSTWYLCVGKETAQEDDAKKLPRGPLLSATGKYKVICLVFYFSPKW